MSNYEGFEVVSHQDATEIRLRDLAASDAQHQNKLADELIDFVKATQPASLVINFQNVAKCTTGAINGLLAIRKLLGSDQAVIHLCEVGNEVRQTLEVLNLSGSLFEIHASLEDALAAS